MSFLVTIWFINKNTYIKVNVSTKLKKQVQNVAESKGLSVSDYIRYQVCKDIEKQKQNYLNNLVSKALKDYKAGKLATLKTNKDVENFHKELMS